VTRPATRPATRLGAYGATLLVAVGGLLTTGALLSPARAETGSAFTRSVQVSREHRHADGSSTTVDTRTVTVSVSQTQHLRGEQQIAVEWTGAHPTGGIVGDPNSTSARLQEYPVMLVECRGVDAADAPAGQRLDPGTCWTQTPDQRYQEDYGTAFPAWRLDRHAEPADRRNLVGVPNPNPCPTAPAAARYVPFVSAANGLTYHGGPGGCGGIPPEATTVEDPSATPSNTTYGVTGLDGRGGSKFVIGTAQQNSSLGCSGTVPCALVIIPIAGISCDVAGAALPVEDRPAPGDEADAAQSTCAAAGHFQPGALYPAGVGSISDTAVTGALWWSASNWRNRITVPLTFAPPGNVCDVLDHRVPVEIYGSELMRQATAQWAPAFCLDPRRFKFQHVSTAEPQAKSALAMGSISAALVSRPPADGYVKPTVTAPVAVTGFAVTYAIDGSDRRPATALRLTPRLLAKLLTESYWDLVSLKQSYAAMPAGDPYAAMANNPRDMSVDPEFVALNPGLGATHQNDAAATLFALSGNSDVMYALTSYLNADPEARAFLNGAPDPWGAVVNPGYKGIELPAESWPLLDTFLAPGIDLEGCLRNDQGQIVPVPILPLVAAPTARLATIAHQMQYAIGNSNTACVPLIDPGGNKVGGSLKPRGRQQPGFRFMLGLTTLADARFFDLSTAALQSDATVRDPAAKFTDASGRHFVVPTEESLRAAMRLATADAATRTWPIPYPALRTAAGADAYPGTMVVYAAVPTAGLDPTVGAHLADLLRFAATNGQQPGLAEGQLPPGYLPMTAANGLGPLASYTQRAADAVAAQRGNLPVLAPGSATPAGATTAVQSGSGPSSAQSGGPSPEPSPALSPWKPGVEMPVGYTPKIDAEAAGWALPVVALLGLLAAMVAGLTPVWATTRMASGLRGRLGQLVELRRRT